MKNEKQHKNSKIKIVQEEYYLNFIDANSDNVSLEKSVKINGVNITFEIDTGSTHTVVSKNVA